MRIFVDIDDTICTGGIPDDYNLAKPLIQNIDKINKSSILNCGYNKGLSVLKVVNEFKKHNKIINQHVTLEQLNLIPSNVIINEENLLKYGLIKSLNNPVKILNVGKLNSKKNISIKNISATAKISIIDSGSTIQSD